MNVNETTYLPTLEQARAVAESVFQNLSPATRAIRLRLCRLVDQAVCACCGEEDLDVLRAAAYLQEIGVVYSSRSKPIYSLQMCEAFFADDGELDPRLTDCIRNHEIDGHPRTCEGLLMRICHKYAATHYLDYMLYKHQLAPERFEKLQMERIEDYRRHFEEHPRGKDIERALQDLFLRPADVSTLIGRFA
jgi:hypothetical protein